MKRRPVRMTAGALLFAAAPCASAPWPEHRSDVLAGVGDRSVSHPRSPVGAERSSGQAEIRRELDEARIRLSVAEARIRREDGQRAVDDATRSAVEEKTRAALDTLSHAGGIAVRDETRGIAITVPYRLLFAPGCADVLSKAAGPLRSVAEALVLEGRSRILVLDRNGSGASDDASSAGLAQRRLDAVREFLVSHGVRSDLVTATSDELGPASDDSLPKVGREKDRGVEIVVETVDAR